MKMKVKLKFIVSVLLLASLIFSAATTSALLPAPSKGKANPPGLEKIVFIHYKRGHAKPPWAPGKGNGNGESKCYDFLAKGAKWKTTEDYRVNPNNADGVLVNHVLDSALAGVNEWEQYGGSSIFGSQIRDDDASYNDGNFDDENTISFGDVSYEGAIGVTTVWGYFSGPPGTRELLEWDMLLDQVDFDWGNHDPSKMDVQNIITHELGHSAGMGDLYEIGCLTETMYGYSEEGETSKRDLNSGDIAGIQKLYN
jgi:hypothetical protein